MPRGRDIFGKAMSKTYLLQCTVFCPNFGASAAHASPEVGRGFGGGQFQIEPSVATLRVTRHSLEYVSRDGVCTKAYTSTLDTEWAVFMHAEVLEVLLLSPYLQSQKVPWRLAAVGV